MELARDYYATLRIESDADAAAIRRAYRKLMRVHHPDVNLSADAGAEATAINEAYACLRDPTRRAAYDGRGRSAPPPAAAFHPVPPRPFHPTWHVRHAELLDNGPPLLKRWKAVSLGLAALVTILTFTLTSAVDPVPPAEDAAAPRVPPGR